MNSEQIERELREQHRQHDELLHTLEVPEYTGRHLQAQWVAKIEDGAITGSTGWTAGAPEDVIALLNVGDSYILELRGATQHTGWIINGQWYHRKSDQDLQRQHEKFVRENREKWATYAEEHREDWDRREAALPDWIRARMTSLRLRTLNFADDPSTRGYELIVCELAALYADMGPTILNKNPYSIEDSDAIRAFADTHGTSGWQHAAALGFAQHYLNDESTR